MNQSLFRNPLALLYRLADRLRRFSRRNRGSGALGKEGEDRAHRWLRSHGFVVAARNWRPPQGGGEIDLIAWDGRELVFVEVKTRAQGTASAPERAIGEEKIAALRRSARDYLRRSGASPTQVRFDVIAIEGAGSGATVDHLRDAFPVQVSVAKVSV